MWVFPLAATAVALGFAVALGRRFLERRQPYLAAWTVSLLMYAVASLAVAAGALFGWNRALFEVYWIFGAVLNVPLLAAGEVQLLARRRSVATATWIVLLFIAAYTIAVTRGAAVHAAALSEQLPSGKEVFGDGTPAHRLPQLISIPSYLVLVGGAAWSAWQMRGRRELRDRFTGTLLIAFGATITAAAGSTFAALGNLPLFSISLLAGVGVMFLGFLRATRVRRDRVPTEPATSD
jgi:hypothetical protein